MAGDERLHRQVFAPPARVTPAVLCALFQEAAGRDADARGFGMARLGEDHLAWMLQRLVVAVEAWPAEPELVVVTWPTPFGGAMAERAFRAEARDGRALVRASSRWALADLRTRRAVRLPPWLRGVVLPERALEVSIGPAPDVPDGEAGSPARHHEVRVADLDRVGHANNTRYVEWGFEALPALGCEGRELRAFDVTFRREARLGDVLSSRTYTLPEGRFTTVLAREADGEPLAVLETRWRAG
jgi:acyl-ACP thioesterase